MKRNRRGFSIVELMLLIIVLGLIFGVVVPMIRGQGITILGIVAIVLLVIIVAAVLNPF